MLSIKIKKLTKKEIERTQAQLLLEKQIKVSQAEIIDKIIENAINDEELLNQLFSPEPKSQKIKGEKVKVKIISRNEPRMRLYKEEWDE